MGRLSSIKVQLEFELQKHKITEISKKSINQNKQDQHKILDLIHKMSIKETPEA